MVARVPSRCPAAGRTGGMKSILPMIFSGEDLYLLLLGVLVCHQPPANLASFRGPSLTLKPGFSFSTSKKVKVSIRDPSAVFFSFQRAAWLFCVFNASCSLLWPQLFPPSLSPPSSLYPPLPTGRCPLFLYVWDKALQFCFIVFYPPSSVWWMSPFRVAGIPLQQWKWKAFYSANYSEPIQFDFFFPL